MNPDGRINLERASIMLVDGAALGMSILAQIFTGFGAARLYKCETASQARERLLEDDIHLVVLSDKIGNEDGYELVRWLRRLEGSNNSFSPVILISGHIRRSMVQRTRDCGANFLVAKPISPQTMLERVIWVSKEGRPFLQTGDYAGPDRRFQVANELENRRRRRNDVKPDAESLSGGAEAPDLMPILPPSSEGSAS